MTVPSDSAAELEQLVITLAEGLAVTARIVETTTRQSTAQLAVLALLVRELGKAAAIDPPALATEAAAFLNEVGADEDTQQIARNLLGEGEGPAGAPTRPDLRVIEGGKA